jgi:hypothetical protein
MPRRDVPVGDVCRDVPVGDQRRSCPVGSLLARRAPPGGAEILLDLDRDTSTASRRVHRGPVERESEADRPREAPGPCGALREDGACVGDTVLRPVPGNTGEEGPAVAILLTCSAVVSRAAEERGGRRTRRWPVLADACCPRLTSLSSLTSSSSPSLSSSPSWRS